MIHKLIVCYLPMITKHLLVVKKLLLLSAVFYTIILIVLSLININNIPDLGSDMDDKIYHVIAYFILSILWITYVKNNRNSNHIYTVAILAVALGASLEVLQYLVNPNRTFDFLDMLANTVGVIIGTIIASRFTLLKLK